MNRSEAETFFEQDEPLSEIRAAYDRGDKGATAPRSGLAITQGVEYRVVVRDLVVPDGGLLSSDGETVKFSHGNRTFH